MDIEFDLSGIIKSHNMAKVYTLNFYKKLTKITHGSFAERICQNKLSHCQGFIFLTKIY